MTTSSRRYRVVLPVGLLLLLGSANAFAPTTKTGASLTRIRPTGFVSKTQQFLTPDQLPDPSLLHHWTTSASQFLADAAAATAAADEPGWWDSYLNVFKGALELVHSTIDGPLRSVGVEQTWGFSIALFTILIRSSLIPLSIQQSKSAEYMKALKPYTAKIREKYKDDQDAQNRAMGKLYEDAEQNPLSGCLVSLAQLPIFLGLYRGVRLLAVDGELNEPFFFIPSLEGPVSAPDYRGLDWLIQGWTAGPDGFPVPQLGWETTLSFLIVPVLLVFLQSLTMRVLQPPMDDNMSEEEEKTLETSQTVLKYLPLLIGVFSIQVPAGLTIYWVATNLFTLTQSLAVRAYYKANPPSIELPEYWGALDGSVDFESMSPEEKRKMVQSGMKVGPTFSDLIDEARFHTFLDRQPVRHESAAWQRVRDKNLSTLVAAELKEWVAAASSSPSATSAHVAAPTMSQPATVESGAS